MRCIATTVAFLTLAGCGTGGDATSDFLDGETWDNDVALAAPPGLTLTPMRDLYYGRDTDFEVTGGSPGDTVYLARSEGGVGSGPCPAVMGGECLSIRSLGLELAGTGVVDATGTATITVNVDVPFVDIGEEWALQAVLPHPSGPATVSDGLEMTIYSDYKTDTFTHTPDRVDVLFVVDDSCSMAEEQAALATDFPMMLGALEASSLDWHAGVVSTDMDDTDRTGKLVDVFGARWVDATLPDPVAVFEEMVLLGTMGAPVEQGRAAAYTALETRVDDYNAGFRRDDAQLAIVVLSDEPDQSLDSTVSHAEFVDWVDAVEEQPDDVTFNSIVGPPADACGFSAAEGTGYLELTDEIGGVVEPVCSGDYGAALVDVADQFWSSDSYYLEDEDRWGINVYAQEPDDLFASFVLPSDYEYDDADGSFRIKGSYRPPAGTVFTVYYYVD